MPTDPRPGRRRGRFRRLSDGVESRKEKPSDAAGDEPASEKGPETVNYTNPMVDVDEDSSGSDDGSGDDDAT